MIRAEGAAIGGIETLYIGRQGSPGEGEIFDILGVDRRGDLTVIDPKRDRAPRDMVAQAPEYAASVRADGHQQLEDRFRDFVGDSEASLRNRHTELFDRDRPLSRQEFDADQRPPHVGRAFTGRLPDMGDFLREDDVDVICATDGTFASEGPERQLNS
ncbi:MAG: hypothetical protein ABEJ34_04180 [Haloferacaceae archaeon]